MFLSEIYNKITWPKWNSPIVFGFLILFGYSLYALFAEAFGRNLNQLLVTVLTCYVLDTAFYYIRFKDIRFTLGGAVSGFGLFFLFDSAYLWMYFLVALVTIAVKHLFTYNERHIFNPTSFSLLVVCFAFQDICTFHSMRWDGQLFFSILFVVLGTALTVYAKRWIVAISFICFFIMFAYIKSLFLPLPFAIMLLPIMGPGLHLYSFFMITDPQTSPIKVNEQIIFAFFVALIDTFFRYKQVRFAQLISLCLVCMVFTLMAYIKNQRVLKNESI